jgi:hypothetical protein
MTVVSLTYKNGAQKGPATDYSMLLEMKRRAAVQNGQIWKSPPGNQNQKPFIRELRNAQGAGVNGALYYYIVRGPYLNFRKF